MLRRTWDERGGDDDVHLLALLSKQRHLRRAAAGSSSSVSGGAAAGCFQACTPHERTRKLPLSAAAAQPGPLTASAHLCLDKLLGHLLGVAAAALARLLDVNLWPTHAAAVGAGCSSSSRRRPSAPALLGAEHAGQEVLLLLQQLQQRPAAARARTVRNSAPRLLACSRTASRVSNTRTIAPIDLAQPMAASPATPPPMTSTLAGGTLPAAVICPVKKRPK